MKLSFVSVFVLCLGVAAAYGKAPLERVHFPANGFSIDALEDPSPTMEARSSAFRRRRVSERFKENSSAR